MREIFDLIVAEFFEDAHVAEGRLDHGLGGRVAVFLEKLLFQGTGVDADADGYQPFPGRCHHLFHLPPFTDIAGIEAQAVNSPLQHLQGEFVVEVDVGNDWDGALALDGAQGLGGCHVGDGAADDFTARSRQGVDLGQGGGRIPRIGVAHGLHRAGGIAAHRYVPHPDLSRLGFHNGA